MILTSIFWVGWLTWKLKDPPNTDKAERRFPNESCFEILVQRWRKKEMGVPAIHGHRTVKNNEIF